MFLEFSSPPPPPTNWKAFIVRYIASPLIQEEYGKLINYWIRYKERSKRESQQPSPQEAKKKIKELEEKVKLLSERNSVLEEKFAILKNLINIVLLMVFNNKLVILRLNHLVYFWVEVHILK